MKKLKEQLEEKTQLLRGAIQNQQNALELMMDQLRVSEDARFQVREQFYISSRRKRREGPWQALRS